MPTGYTADLYEGKDVSFEQFALTAARGMGAAIMQRDDAPGPIADEYEPSDYYKKSLAKSLTKVAEFRNRTHDQWVVAEKAERDEMTAHVNGAIKTAGERRVRYELMLAQVEAWVPPTPEHENFKKFMTEQLTSSIDFDCSTSYLKTPPVKSPEVFKAEQIAKAEKDAARDAEEWEKEQERTASRNKWVRDLRESLKP